MGKFKHMLTILNQRGVSLKELINYLIMYEKGFPKDIFDKYIIENSAIINNKKSINELILFVGDKQEEDNEYIKYWKKVTDVVLYKFLVTLFINDEYVNKINKKINQISDSEEKNIKMFDLKSFLKFARDKYFANKYNRNKPIFEEEFIAIVTEPINYNNKQLLLTDLLKNIKDIFMLNNKYNYNSKFVEYIRKFYIFIIDDALDEYLSNVWWSNINNKNKISKNQLTFSEVTFLEYYNTINNLSFDTRNLFKNYFEIVSWYKKQDNQFISMSWRMKHIDTAIKVHTLPDKIYLKDISKKIYNFHDFLEVFIKGKSIIKEEVDNLIYLIGGY